MSEKRGFSQRWGHLEAYALDLVATMTFSAVTGEGASSATWAEFPVAVGVRPRQ